MGLTDLRGDERDGLGVVEAEAPCEALLREEAGIVQRQLVRLPRQQLHVCSSSSEVDGADGLGIGTAAGLPVAGRRWVTKRAQEGGGMRREEGPREAEEVVADAAGVEQQKQRWLDTWPDSRTNLRPIPP